jgi:hypothetical protein
MARSAADASTGRELTLTIATFLVGFCTGAGVMTCVALFGAIKAQDRLKRLQLWDAFQTGQPFEDFNARAEREYRENAKAAM